MDRRRFLGAAALAGAAAALPGWSGRNRYRIALSAYSMRKYLDLKNGSMDLAGFLDKCAEWGFDGAELTEYYFRKPLAAAEVMALKRKALALGLDVTGTPIGNTFT